MALQVHLTATLLPEISFQRISLNKQVLFTRQGLLLPCSSPMPSIYLKGNGKEVEVLSSCAIVEFLESSTLLLYLKGWKKEGKKKPQTKIANRKKCDRVHDCCPKVSAFPCHSWWGTLFLLPFHYFLNLGRWTARLSQLAFSSHLRALGGFFPSHPN